MKINKDIRTISGEHSGIQFTLEGGLLLFKGQKYSKAEIRALVQISNLLEIEGFRLAESIPIVKRRSVQQLQSYFGIDWAQEYLDDYEGGQ